MKNQNSVKTKKIKNEILERDSGIQYLFFNGADKPVINENIDLTEIQSILKKDGINWIHCNLPKSLDNIEKIGRIFDFHSLLLEDIVNTELLPKVEYYNDHLIFTLKHIILDNKNELQFDHVSIVLGNNYVLTFQNNEGSFYNQAKERCLNLREKIGKNGTDFLFYIIIDLIVDRYFGVMEYFRDQLDEIEDLIVENPNKNYIHELHELRKKIVVVRKFVFSLLESVQNMISDEPAQLSDSNIKYFNDIKDHVQYNFQLVESFKEDQRGLVELNQSNQSNNMAQVMKTLTIISSIFIPLTFIVGLYGMNFHYMPELSWKYGYFGVLILMLLVSLVMIWYINRKKWF